MGDRGNVKIVDQGSGVNDVPAVFLYSYDHGSKLMESVVLPALRNRVLYDDGASMARLVFCWMLSHYDQDTPDTMIGLGIGTALGDYEHPVITLDCERQRIRLEDQHGGILDGSEEMTFEEFIDDPTPLMERYAKGIHG